MLPESGCTHIYIYTHFQSHSGSDVWRIFFGKLTERWKASLCKMEKWIKILPKHWPIDLSAKCFPKASDLYFMLVHWLQICHYGHTAVKPKITCRAKITCPIKLPWEVMAHKARLKKSDRKRNSQGRGEWARGMKKIYSKMKRQDRTMAQRREKRKWVMLREGKSGGGRMMCKSRADKAELGAAGELGVCQPSSQ